MDRRLTGMGCVGLPSLAALLALGGVAVVVVRAASAQSGGAEVRSVAASSAGAATGAGAQARIAAATSAQPASAGQAAAGRAATIESRVSLVSVDIVVTDALGHSVVGLRPSDFSVYEDGAKMTPRSFEEHRAQYAAPAAVAAPVPKVAPETNVFTNFSDVHGNGALNVLLLDLLNTPPQDQMRMRQQMLDYLKQIPSGMRMAVFGLNTQLQMLQGFTSDPEILKRVVMGSQGVKQSTLLRTAQDDDADNDALAMLNGDGDPTQAAITQALASFQAEGAAMQTVVRIEDTLGALNVLARYLGGLPGRKNLIWFSGSFPAYLSNFFQGSVTGITKPLGPSVQQDFTGEMRITSDLLARAQVAVYPIDARGIFTNPATKVDTSESSLTNPFSNGMPSARSDPTAVPKAFAQSEVKMEKQNDEEYASMDQIADQTGGRAQYGTNDLKQAVENAIESGANYYTVTYVPANYNWNGSFRTIKVTTDFQGAKLAYRRGYFALAGAGASNGVGPSTMQRVMIHGAPNATQIVFKVKIDAKAGTENALPKGDHPNVKRMRPPYRHYIVWYAADLHNVAFAQTPDGIYHGEVVYEARLCDSDGGVLNSVTDEVHANVPKDRYLELLRQGLYVQQEIDAPVKGNYYLRIGMHDPASDRVGAMEIPLAAVKVEMAADTRSSQ